MHWSLKFPQTHIRSHKVLGVEDKCKPLIKSCCWGISEIRDCYFHVCLAAISNPRVPQTSPYCSQSRLQRGEHRCDMQRATSPK